MGWTRLALRRLRDDRAATLGLALLVLVTAFLAALAPRVLAGLADSAVRAEVASATVPARNIAAAPGPGILAGPADDPLALVREAGLDHEATFPAAVRALITSRSAVLESGRFRVTCRRPTRPSSGSGSRRASRDDVRYVEGRAPTGAVTTQDDVGAGAGRRRARLRGGHLARDGGAVRAAARRDGAPHGDPGDPLIGRGPADLYAFATLTGSTRRPIRTIRHLARRHDCRSGRLSAPCRAEVQLLDAALLLADDAIAPLNDHMEVTGRVPALHVALVPRPRRLSDRALDRTITAFRRLNVMYPSPEHHPGQRRRAAHRDAAAPRRVPGALGVRAVAPRGHALGPALVAIATLALIASSPRAAGGPRWRSPGAAARPGRRCSGRWSLKAC